MSESNAKSEVKSTLALTLTAGASELWLDVAFTNGEGVEVLLYNRLSIVSPDGSSSRVDPNAAYVELLGETLHVRKMVLPLPPGLQAAEKLSPYLSKVAPGETVRERLVFPLPVKVEQPYRRALLQSKAPPGHRVSASRAASAKALTHSLGMVTLGPGERLIEVEPLVYRIWPPGPAADRQVVLEETVDRAAQPIAVLDYDG
jgi:hypothetical protein